MENKTRFPAFIGASNTMRNRRFDCERTVNMYLEGIPQNSPASGKDNETMTLVGTPGLKLLMTLGTGPIRAIYSVSTNNKVYVVSGYQIFVLDATLLNPVLVGTMLTNTGPVSIADNGVSGQTIVFVDGAYGYYSTLTGVPSLTQIVSANFYPASTVSFQDGYFIFCQTGTSYFFLSDLYAITFPALNMANKSGDSDILIATITNNRELYLLGQNTIEMWWNYGASGSTPFARQAGKFSQNGCISAATVVRINNTIMWLGSNPQGGLVVYEMQNESAVRVSTNAVEFSIQNTGVSPIAASAYAWQIEGHYFYTLNVPGANTTWLYDIMSGQWTEMQSNIKGTIGRHLGSCHANYLGTHLVGDYVSGNLYAYDFNTYTDGGNPIMRIRQAPHIADNQNMVFYKLLQIDLQPGTGLVAGVANAIAPSIMLEISDDGGMTFGMPLYATMGAAGQFLTRARFQRLGKSRDRVFRVSCSDPVQFNLISAQLDIEVGTN